MTFHFGALIVSYLKQPSTHHIYMSQTSVLVFKIDQHILVYYVINVNLILKNVFNRNLLMAVFAIEFKLSLSATKYKNKHYYVNYWIVKTHADLLNGQPI